MEIRLLHKSDLKLLLALYHHLHDTDDPLPDEATIANVWGEIEQSSRYCYFGAFKDGELVSSCCLTVIPNLTRGCRPYGVIENVVTHKEHRKQGLGKAVLTHALQHAWTTGCYKAMLLTGRKDQATLDFYESAGFDPNDKRAFIAKPPA